MIELHVNKDAALINSAGRSGVTFPNQYEKAVLTLFYTVFFPEDRRINDAAALAPALATCCVSSIRPARREPGTGTVPEDAWVRRLVICRAFVMSPIYTPKA